METVWHFFRCSIRFGISTRSAIGRSSALFSSSCLVPCRSMSSSSSSSTLPNNPKHRMKNWIIIAIIENNFHHAMTIIKILESDQSYFDEWLLAQLTIFQKRNRTIWLWVGWRLHRCANGMHREWLWDFCCLGFRCRRRECDSTWPGLGLYLRWPSNVHRNKSFFCSLSTRTTAFMLNGCWHTMICVLDT